MTPTQALQKFVAPRARSPEIKRYLVDPGKLENLILQSKTGNQQAFNKIMMLYARHLRAFLSLVLPDQEIVKRVAKATCIRAYNGMREVRDFSGFERWFFALSLERCRMDLRSHQGNREWQGEFANYCSGLLSSRFNVDIMMASYELLLEHANSLSAADLEILEMRYGEGKSTALIATLTHQEEKVVRDICYMLRQDLVTNASNALHLQSIGDIEHSYVEGELEPIQRANVEVRMRERPLMMFEISRQMAVHQCLQVLVKKDTEEDYELAEDVLKTLVLRNKISQPISDARSKASKIPVRVRVPRRTSPRDSF